MKILSSNRNKIILLLFISIVVFILWQSGFETVYARVLTGTTNYFLNIAKKDTHIELERNKEKDGVYQFRVFTIMDEKKGNYPQETGSLLQPFVIILSWQIFLLFVLDRRSFLKTLWINMGIFILIQIFFLVMLTGYYNSKVQQFFYTVLIDSFYVIALVLVIKDNMLFPLFRKNRTIDLGNSKSNN